MCCTKHSLGGVFELAELAKLVLLVELFVLDETIVLVN